MPTICRFHGVVIVMYRDDHSPPHFHVRYAGMDAQVHIEPLHIERGQLPPRIERMVLDWAAGHITELQHNWDLAIAGHPAAPIEPPK